MADIEVRLDTTGMDRLLATEPQKVGRWLSAFTQDLTNQIILSFGSSPPGRTYSRGQGRVHVASSPGYPPNVDEGSLWASVYWENTGPHHRTIYVGVEHGEWQELGTSRIAPRPFMRPAFEDAQKRIGQDARSNLGLEQL